MMSAIASCRVLIKGAGDLASGVAVRLARTGFPLLMTEVAAPLAVRRSVAFAEAIYAGQTMVEEIAAHAVPLAAARFPRTHRAGAAVPAAPISITVDPDGLLVARLQPDVVIDAIMAKRNLGTALADAPTVIALGPGFAAGVDCHAVIETNRGHNLGRVIWQGDAEPDTGLPGPVTGVGVRAERVLRAPVAGHVTKAVPMGARVAPGDWLATVTAGDGSEHRLSAPFAGVLRGMVHPAVAVTVGMKIGDLDPRIEPAHCFTVSDKSLAVGGGVLEAILIRLRRSGQHPLPDK